MFKRKWYWALAAFVVLCIGSFVTFKPKAPLEPIKIYKATPAPKPSPPKGNAAEIATPANPPHAHPQET